MMKKLILFGLLISGLLFSCQNLNPIDPPQEFKSIDNFGTLVDTTFMADSAFFITNPYVLNNGSEKLSLGNYKGFKASILIHFTKMPSDSGATYDSIFVILNRNYTLGQDVNFLNATVSVPTKEWSDSANTMPEWHQYQPSQPFYSFSISADDSNKIIIPIPKTVFNTWVEEKENNKGFFLTTTDQQSSFIVELNNFYTGEPLKWPKLVYRKVFSDTIEHDTSNVGLAATIFDYDVESPQSVFSIAQKSNDLIVSSGIGSRVLVHFKSLDSIPSSSIIYSADLLFNIKDEDFFDPSQPNLLSNAGHPDHYYLRLVKAVSSNRKSVVVDSVFKNNTYYSYSLDGENGMIHFTQESDQIRFGKSFIQNYLNGKFFNTWFLLQYQNEKMDISVKRLQSILEHGVRLRVRYYVVKSKGF